MQHIFMMPCWWCYFKRCHSCIETFRAVHSIFFLLCLTLVKILTEHSIIFFWIVCHDEWEKINAMDNYTVLRTGRPSLSDVKSWDNQKDSGEKARIMNSFEVISILTTFPRNRNHEEIINISLKNVCQAICRWQRIFKHLKEKIHLSSQFTRFICFLIGFLLTQLLYIDPVQLIIQQSH